MKTDTKVIDKGWNRIKREVSRYKNSYVGVGFFGGGGLTIVKIAFWNEFGTKRIPKRPFMRQTYAKYIVPVSKIIMKEYDYVLRGKSTARNSLNRVGEWYVGKMKYTITNGNFIANKPATIRRKKSSRPLIDTGEMRNSITKRVFML